MDFDWVELWHKFEWRMWSADEGAIIRTYGPNLIKAIATFVIGKWVAKFIRKIVGKALSRGRVDSTLASFVLSLVYLTTMIFVSISAIGVLGVQTGSFVALVGAAGLALGFALQGSLSNFASGVMLIIFRPFKIGDYIEAAGVAGTVEQIQMFATSLRTADNKLIIVPNAGISGGNITNYSVKPTRRVDLVFGIGYDDDIKATKDLLLRLMNEDARVLKDPAPFVAVGELAESSVNMLCRPWVKTGDYWDVLRDLNEKVKLEMDKAGISIPFPQRDVHLHKVEDTAA